MNFYHGFGSTGVCAASQLEPCWNIHGNWHGFEHWNLLIIKASDQITDTYMIICDDIGKHLENISGAHFTTKD